MVVERIPKYKQMNKYNSVFFLAAYNMYYLIAFSGFCSVNYYFVLFCCCCCFLLIVGNVK